MEILSQIFYFIIIIGVLVLVHELGHFLAAKAFKMRVERFSIGFPPRAFGKQIGETDYCISWLPIGGYVKIAGMIDESLDVEHLQAEPEPWEFRAKPIWQRIIVITAGVIMNVVLAVMIFWGLNLAGGKQYHEVTTIGYVQPESMAANAGLLKGDKVLSINETHVHYWEDIEKSVAYEHLSGNVAIEIERAGHKQILHIARGILDDMNQNRFGVVPEGSQALIGGVEPDMPASKAGIEKEDVILSINEREMYSSQEVISVVSANANTTVTITWKRGSRVMTGSVTPDATGKIGILLVSKIAAPIVTVEYGLIEAFTVGVSDLTNITILTVKNIWHVITGQASFRKSIGGPVKIAEMAAQQAEVGLASFLGLMAILSISLAIINIFPFPALDGGHLMFLFYEAIFRREVPNKLRIALQQAGMVLLLAFMIFVIYNDIFH